MNDADKVERVVSAAYRRAQEYLTSKVSELFKRAQNQTGIEEKELKAVLNSNVPIEELTELKRLAKNISNPEMRKSAKNKLTALAFKERITRIEDLKAKSFLVSKQLSDIQLENQTDFYIDAIHESYKEASSEAIIRKIEQKGVKFTDWNNQKQKEIHGFKELSTQYTKRILESHWHGSNYSKRIWSDTEALASRLEELFTVESMTGMSEQEMARAIAKEFDQSIGVARRLIRTEANYMSNQAKLKAWKDRGIKHYKLVVILDLRTSNICQQKSNEDKVYEVSEAIVNGAEGNYPPFHPWCRTIAVIYIENISSKGNRIANDPIEDKTFIISKDATYNNWISQLKEQYSDEEIETKKKKIKASY
ncbi:Phage capsid and scaffold protein [Enterococcus faecalis AZ19]|uniref:minor capsid protein n=1 Tax=Enterococcus faecalis TaxID=1351 RepID=UPI000459E17B|nr:Phage capsid and scaffold protein [Enterococcus faecalis AZ19]